MTRGREVMIVKKRNKVLKEGPDWEEVPRLVQCAVIGVNSTACEQL
jgi:hypothetical protein